MTSEALLASEARTRPAVPASNEPFANSEAMAGPEALTTPYLFSPSEVVAWADLRGGNDRLSVSSQAGFWFCGALLCLFLMAATAPSPLYSIYQRDWHFSAVVLTGIFAAYTVAILVSLLLFGSLSDHIGRKPVLLGAVVVEIASLEVLALAPDVNWLYLGRLFQGLATGAASSAISGALLDLQPSGTQRGAIVTSVGATSGIALGAVFAGALVEFVPAPTVLPYILLLAAMGMGFIGVLVLPNTGSGRTTSVLRILRPQIPRVPSGHFGTFALLATSMVASWTVGGMFLSLGPSVAKGLVTGNPYLIGGLTIGALAGTASLAQLACAKWPGRRAVRYGSPLLIVGLVVLSWAVISHNATVFLGATLVMGIGWGLTFMGGFRMMVALAKPEQRAATSAMIYVVTYTSATVPTIMLGFLATKFGLTSATIIFSTIAALFSALAGLSTFAYRR